MFREIEAERRRRETERYRRGLFVIAALLLALSGWMLGVHVPGGRYGLDSFPDGLFYSGGGYYDYTLGMVFNPSSRCGPLPTPRAGMLLIGHITDVASDETGSLGYVRQGDGPAVFANPRRLDSGRPPWMLYAYSSPGCYLAYRESP